MAEHQLAHRYEGKAQGSFCRHPCAHSRRTTTANQGQGPATSARGGGLAHRRTQDVRREEILSRQPAGEDGPAHLGGHHQGEMDLRAGSPTAERRTRSRSLRGTILARPSPSCAHDDDRICLPPASPPFNSKAGKKESTGHRPSRLYQPCATPSSNSSLDHHRSDVRIAENGFATSSGVSESAKVVLVARFIQIEGYRCLSLMRAVGVVKCQLALAWLALRSCSQAAISSMRVCLSGMRRSRHWDDRTPSSDSARSSQLPCFGV